jgi:hypothetical protein
MRSSPLLGLGGGGIGLLPRLDPMRSAAGLARRGLGECRPRSERRLDRAQPVVGTVKSSQNIRRRNQRRRGV